MVIIITTFTNNKQLTTGIRPDFNSTNDEKYNNANFTNCMCKRTIG